MAYHRHLELSCNSEITFHRKAAMNSRSETVGWFSFRWAVPILVSWSLALIAVVALWLIVQMIIFFVFVGDSDRDAPFAMRVVLFLVPWGVFGIAIGIGQWVVLRREIPQIKPWIWATLAGFLVGSFVDIALMNGGALGPRIDCVLCVVASSNIIDNLGQGIVLGAVLGLTQWAVLRGKLDMAAG